MKSCPSCKTAKPATEFHKNRAKADGLATECKPCTKQRVAVYRHANRAAVNARKRAHREANRELINESKRSRYPERKASERAYRDANPHIAWKARYVARVKKYGITPVIEDFTRSDVVARYGDACFHCGGPFVELDHYPVPVALAGSHTLSNVRPSCVTCNRKTARAARAGGYGTPLETS